MEYIAYEMIGSFDPSLIKSFFAESKDVAIKQAIDLFPLKRSLVLRIKQTDELVWYSHQK